MVIDATARLPRIHAIFMAYNYDLANMADKYAQDSNVATIMFDLTNGQPHD